MLQDPRVVFPAGPNAIFPSRAFQRLARDLDQALQDRVGTIILTGPPGIGKTTALEALSGEWSSQPDLKVVFLTAPGQPALPQQEPSAAVTTACQQVLRSPDSRVVLIVDDAQSLGAVDRRAILGAKAARLAEGKVTTLIFVHGGDMPNGAEPSLSKDNQRLHLLPLGRDEIEPYLRHGLAGSNGLGAGDGFAFDAEAIALLFDLSRGVPRFISHFAQQALHEALRENRQTIGGDLVRACLLDSAQLDGAWRVPGPEPLQEKTSPSALGTDAANKAARVGELDALRADASRAIPPPCGRKARGWPVVAVAVAIGSAAVVAWQDRVPVTGAATQDQRPQAVRPLPRPVQPVVEAVAIPDRPPVPLGLDPPDRVSADADPAQLLNTGLSAELTDPTRASILYEGAALTGNPRAAYFLGQLFETGSGVPRDLRRAQAWYSVAGKIAGAGTRLVALDDLPAGEGGPIAAPFALTHLLFGSGRAALHWRNGPGMGPQRYVVEYVLADDAGQVRQAQTTLSAISLKGPVIRWRVVSLDDQGRRAGTSAWSSLVPPPR